MCNVYVEVGFEPSEDLVGNANLILEWVDAAGEAQEICRRENSISKHWGKDRVQKQFELGDWQILRGKASQEHQIECPEPGECRLRAAVEYRGMRAKSAARTVYVQTEPPPPPEKNLVTLSISATNISRDQKRIDHGEVLQLQINARNRMAEAGAFYFVATLADEVFAKDLPVELEGTPVGDTPRKQSILTEKRRLLDPRQTASMMFDEIESLAMPESSGMYHIRAELADANGNVVANASCPVYFQRDPGNAKNNLPFEIEQKDQKAMWELNTERTKLTYPRDYPLYKELPVPQRQQRAIQANLAFIAEISANGLLEWAMRPKLQERDDSNFDQLYDESRDQGDKLWDDFNRGLENLSKAVESPIEYSQAWRETVAIMLEIFQREND